MNQYKIAEMYNLTPGRISQIIKQAAAEHPISTLSIEERAAMAEAKWNQSEQEIKNEIARQREEGRETIEMIKFPDGSVQQKVTRVKGVDPALLRALSIHHDRRNRQAQNQFSPDAGVSQVNVAVVQDFLKQGEGGKQLTASDWNDNQGTIDV